MKRFEIIGLFVVLCFCAWLGWYVSENNKEDRSETVQPIEVYFGQYRIVNRFGKFKVQVFQEYGSSAVYGVILFGNEWWDASRETHNNKEEAEKERDDLIESARIDSLPWEPVE